MNTIFVDPNETPAEQVLMETVGAHSGKENKALSILEWAAHWHYGRGYDAIWVYKQAVAQLEQVGLSQNDFLHFERRIARLTRVNE